MPRKTALHISNQTGQTLLSGSLCHKHGDSYTIECAWPVLQHGETARADYCLTRTGRDWRVITWMDLKGNITVARCPEDMERVRTIILKSDRIVFSPGFQPYEIRSRQRAA